MKKYELSIRDYWRIIRRRRNIIIFTALVFPIATVALTLVQKMTPVYSATAGVRIEKSTSMTGLFLDILAVPSGDYLATQTLVIKSSAVLEKVAEEAGLIPHGASEEPHAAEKYGNILSELQSRIKTEQEGNTSVINVTVSSGDPKAAERLANLVVDKYKEENILSKNRQIFEARKFIEDQLQIVESRLKTAENAINLFKKQNDVVSISDEQKADLEKFSALDAGREKIDMDLKETEYNLGILKEGKAIPQKASVRLFTDTDANQSIVSRLNSRLSDLLLERNNLLIGFTPAHPQVKEVDEKVANVRVELKAQLESQRNTLMKKKELVSADLGKLKAGLYMLPTTAMELSRLEREVKINEELYTLLKTKYQEALIKEAEKVEEVSIIKRASEPTAPDNPPKVFANGMLGLALGIIFGLVFAFVVESLDTSIGTIEDIEDFLGVHVIGVIPNLYTGDVTDFLKTQYNITGDWELRTYHALISHFMPQSIPAECYRALRTNVLFTAGEKNLKSIMVAGSARGEGKTVTAINLALVLAQVGKRVLLIDADFRNPSIHQYFGIGREPGLSNVILGNNTWQEVVRTITDIMLGGIKVDDLMATPGIDNLNIVTSGLTVTQPSEFLNSERIPELIKEMGENYDFIIFDAPPVLPVADAAILSSRVDGVFIIYEAGKIARAALKRTASLLGKVGVTILGVILNNVKAETNPDLHHSGMYKYYQKEQFAGDKGVNISDRFSSLARRIKSKRE